jgi:hypothetical protein
VRVHGCIAGCSARGRTSQGNSSRSVTWPVSNRCQINSGQQLSQISRHKGLRDDARELFWMRKMLGGGDKWGCVPPRPFAPSGCLTTRHKEHLRSILRCTWTTTAGKNGSDESCDANCFFFRALWGCRVN